MSKFFKAALFVSLAAAEATTTAWLPGPAEMGMTYSGSVVTVSGDRTVMVIDSPEPSATDDGSDDVGPQTVTLQGNTYVEYQASATEQGIVATISAACSRSNTDDKEATCTMSTLGLEDAMSTLSSLCQGPQSAADYCTDASGFGTEMTTTLPEGYFGMFPLVVTAGDDLLPAATPSAGEASATPTTGFVGATPAQSGSASGIGAAKTNAASAASSAASAASSAASGAAAKQSTAGAPMMTMAPAVAALGAAAAFFL